MCILWSNWTCPQLVLKRLVMSTIMHKRSTMLVGRPTALFLPPRLGSNASGTTNPQIHKAYYYYYLDVHYDRCVGVDRAGIAL